MFYYCLNIICIIGVLLGSGSESYLPGQHASRSPLSGGSDGSCKAGTEYVITRIEDLKEKMHELECIFAAGETPEKVPLGYSYGTILSAANTAFWNDTAASLYNGDYVVGTNCGGVPTNVGWLNVAGFDIGTAIWYIGKFPFRDELASGEYPLGDKDGIIMDFRVDIKSLCGIQGNENANKYKNFLPFKNSIFPINTYVDIARVVGRTNDGAIITLNKAFATPLLKNQGASTVLFYATRTYDPDIMPKFSKFQSIFVPPGPNGEKEINYTRRGIGDPIYRLNPMAFFADVTGLAARVAERDNQSDFVPPLTFGNRNEIYRMFRAEWPKSMNGERASFLMPWLSGLKLISDSVGVGP